jgi:protein phosphatase
MYLNVDVMTQQEGSISFLNQSIAYYAQTDTGMVREINEDNFIVLDSAGVFCVADGMGGYDAGEVASGRVVQAVGDFYRYINDANHTLPSTLSKEMVGSHPLLGSVLFAHHQLLLGEQAKRMGSTFAAVQFEEGGVAVCHVGDSRVYLFHHGKLIQLTSDHSVVGALVENGAITAEQAKTHPQRNAILQAVGFTPEIQPDLHHYGVSSGDKLLICSDGVTSMLTDEQLVEILNNGTSPAQQGQLVINQANNAGGKDNITLILIDIT